MRELDRAARAAVEVIALRVVARTSMRLCSLDRAVRVAARLGALGGRVRRAPDEALREVALATDRWMPEGGWLGARCLERSIVRLAMLRRRRLDAHMCIGVTISAGRVSAHAWNTLDGRVLFGDTEHARVRPIWDSCGAFGKRRRGSRTSIRAGVVVL